MPLYNKNNTPQILNDKIGDPKKNKNTYGVYLSNSSSPSNLTPISPTVSYSANIQPVVTPNANGNSAPYKVSTSYYSQGTPSSPTDNTAVKGANVYSKWLKDLYEQSEDLPNTPIEYSPNSRIPEVASFTGGAATITAPKDYYKNVERFGSSSSKENSNGVDNTKKEEVNTETTPVKTYEEFIANQRNEAIQRAETTRERSVVDARSSYEQNKASYGANAEALGNMGLTGSGYSDYLNSSAYAQMRADTQAANAQADSAIREANSAADKAQFEWEENKKAEAEEKASYARAAYTELLAGANTGSYTVEQIEQLSADYGLSDTQKQSLVTAVNDYNTKKQAASNAQMYENTGNVVGAIQSAVDSGSITKEDGQTHLYNEFSTAIANGYADLTVIDKASSNQQITPEQYEDLKKQWNDNIDATNETFCDKESGAMLTKSAAKTTLEEILNNPWCSKEKKEKLEKLYDELYTAKTSNVRFNKDGKVFSPGDLDTYGNNFSLVDSDGTKYRIESGGKVSDKNIIEVGESVGDGEVFAYQDILYLKKDGNIYYINWRDNKTWHDDYSNLYEKFYGKPWTNF